MYKEQLKKKACEVIDANKEKLCAIGHTLFTNPELGYKEVLASQMVRDTFDELGIAYERDLAITGVKGKLNNKTNINVAIVSELDAVVCPSHPDANKNTGAAHCCGHFAQVVGMLGSAMALSTIKEELDGNVSFFAVPAEECVELEYRQQLMKENKIKYLGGKQELLRLGYFDDVDMAMLIHGMNSDAQNTIKASSSGVGFLAKTVKFIGKEAHAGVAPWDGVNALNAATLALTAINSLRETFKEADCIKIHPIITKGGTLVNIVPNDVRIEMYIRGATIEAIKDANQKVNRAVKGCAYALGCEAEIIDMPGYLPVTSYLPLSHVFKDNAEFVCPDANVICATEIEGISSDLGDVTSVLPCTASGVGGFLNGFHTKDFKIGDEELIYIVPAKILACTVIDLLTNEAEKAKEIKASYHAKYSSKEYDGIWDAILNSNDKEIA